MLCDWHRNASDVDFLKRVFSQKRSGDITSDCHNRRRVHICRGDSCDKIRGTRAARREHDSDFSGGTGVAVRSVRSTLFVRRENVANAALVFVKLVIDVQNIAARISKYSVNALLDKALDYNL